MKTLVIARIRQLAQEQAETQELCIKRFGGFQGLVSVPDNLDLEPDAQLIKVLEKLVATKAARESATQC